MQATEEVGAKPLMAFSIRKEGISELQDVLTLYLARFYKSAYRQPGNAADAEDAVQDAMLAAAGCLPAPAKKRDSQLNDVLGGAPDASAESMSPGLEKAAP